MASEKCDRSRDEKIEEYFSCLDKAYAHEVDFPRAIELKKELLPKSLFKYQRFDTNKSAEPGAPNEDYCLQNLRNLQIRLTAPLDFNDPYDSASYFLSENVFKSLRFDVEAFLSIPQVRDNMSDERKQSLRASDGKPETIHDILLRDIPDELSRQISLQLRSQVFTSAGQDMVRRMNDFFRKMTRVCSFCEVNNSIAMWSHYGGFHRGFCLEYNAAHLALAPNILGWLHPVRYSLQLFDVTKYLEASFQYQNCGGPISNNWATIIACHKSPEWAYEKEWRIVTVDQRDSFGIQPVSVILSARIDDLPKQKAALLDIANQLKLPIKQMVPSQDRFELTLVDYQP